MAAKLIRYIRNTSCDDSREICQPKVSPRLRPVEFTNIRPHFGGPYWFCPQSRQAMKDFDQYEFWEQSDYANKSYVDAPLTDELLYSIETELGYKLPTAYVELARIQNGGFPKRTSHRTSEPTSWARDHVSINGIFAIGRSKTYGLCARIGSRFMMEEWGYPPIGVYFADCPSAGHDMLCLDYLDCGPQGEPTIVHVDQNSDYKITFVAKDFATFIRGLELNDAFNDE